MSFSPAGASTRRRRSPSDWSNGWSPRGEERAGALELAQLIASGAPLAVRSTRDTLRHGLAEAARRAMDHELAEQTALAGTADAVEGVNAMLEGRGPVFQGR